MKIQYVVTAAAGLAVLAACGQSRSADQSVVNDTTEDLKSDAGVFSTYSEPGGPTNPVCATGVRLILDKAQISGDVAFLEDFVSGVCEIVVDPNPRHYFLKKEKAGCGSIKLTGTSRSLAFERTLSITDHRSRVCRDIVPARLIVEETTKDLSTGEEFSATTFSDDRQM